MPTRKQEVLASQAVVAANHPLAAAAGIELLAQGGNAVDACVAALFALSVVEPMMVGPAGAGFFVIRDGPSGALATIDNYAVVPAGATPTMYAPIPGSLDYETVGKANDVGYRAIAVPGALKGWAHAVARFGRLPLAAAIAPAIRAAEHGVIASPYLASRIAEAAGELGQFPAGAAIFLRDGRPLAAGSRIIQADYARSLRRIAAEGADTLYRGELGAQIVAAVQAHGGILSRADLADYRVVEREPVRGSYRGHEIVAMAPPSSGGTHVIELLNILEGYALGRGELRFGSPAYAHLLAEALKIVFADRRRYMADPDRVPVPVAALSSKAYAARRRAGIDPRHASDQAAGDLGEVRRFLGGESSSTTHVTVVDAEGTMVSATQTLNWLFGSKVAVAGTGVFLNNCMVLMDPVPGNANSIAPGKRILSSMAPTIVLRNGAPFLALGTPGAKRIFPAVTQVILNVIDHGMSLQAAVEAPRLWTQGAELELEQGFAERAALAEALGALGHDVIVVPKVAGGMNGVLVDAQGLLHGAACWRADGTPMGISGGPAHLPDVGGIPV